MTDAAREAPARAGSRPLLVVLSGPSGVGKDAVLDELERRGHRFHRVVTCTTRPPRDTMRCRVIRAHPGIVDEAVREEVREQRARPREPDVHTRII